LISDQIKINKEMEIEPLAKFIVESNYSYEEVVQKLYITDKEFYE